MTAPLRDQLTAALGARYQLLSDLGSGGSATVYRAVDRKHGRDVAIKVLRPEFAATLAGERFLREIATIARLQHPHIVPLLDSGDRGGYLYFVMPYIEGETLRARLARSGRLPVPDVIRILADVADALVHAHQRHVVHRDLKPENILLSGRHALVTDFGVARAASLAGAERPQLTMGVALGTPAYMSPEQAVASPEVDHRADLYALGIIGYELLAGRPPFSAATPQEVLTMHVALTPEPLESHRPEVPADLNRVVMRCLEKRPVDRWQSASELVSVLEPLATPSGGVTPTGVMPARPPARIGRRTSIVAVGAVLLALLLLLAERGFRRPASGPPAGVNHQQLTYLGNVLDAAPSPDGQFLAYVVEDSAGQRIMVRDLSGGNVVQAASGQAIASMAWSPDGLEVRYSVTRPARGTWAVPRLGGTPRPLVADFGIPSPDGLRVAWARSAPRTVRIRGPRAADSVEIPLPFDYRWALMPAWAPDGERLAIPLLGGDGSRSSLAIVNLRRDRPPYEIAADSLLKLAAVWAPDGRSLYYLALRGRFAVLHRVELDGQGRVRGPPLELASGLEPGTSAANSAARLAISGDGRRLVYVRERASSNLGLLPVGGDTRTDYRPLTSGTALHTAARLSSDGRRLSFLRTEPAGQVMSVQTLDQGVSLTEVTMVGEGYEIAWSAIDNRVAITTTDSARAFGIRVFRPGSPERQDYLVGQVGAHLEWAPDGRVIYQRSGNQRFGMLDPATGHDTVLAMPDGEGWVFDPRLSPDGRTLAWRWNREGEVGLFVGPLGGPGRQLIASGDVRPIRWSPDGRRLWAAERPLGDTRERLAEVLFPAGTIRIRHTLPSEFSLSDITPDGRRMVVTRRERQSDAWLIELP